MYTPRDLGYIGPNPCAAFDLANRFLAQERGICYPPEAYISVQVQRRTAENNPWNATIGWKVTLQCRCEGTYVVEMDAEMTFMEIYEIPEVPPGQLRLVS